MPGEKKCDGSMFVCGRRRVVREMQRGEHKNYSSQKRNGDGLKMGKTLFNLQLVGTAWGGTSRSICRSDGISCD